MKDSKEGTCAIVDLRQGKVQFKRRPSTKKYVGDQIDSIELDHIVKTQPEDNKQRRTLLLSKRNGSWGFTLQSYGVQKVKKKEVDVLTYVDYVDMGGAAHLAGLRAGDVILSINGQNMEQYSHRDMVAFIKSCGNAMRMVVLFEDCVKKVELHMRYLKLQRLLTTKMYELRALEQQEKNIKEGVACEHDPRRLSLASYTGNRSALWYDDTTSFLSLRPDIDICPSDYYTNFHGSSASLQYSPSLSSFPEEPGVKCLDKTGMREGVRTPVRTHSSASLLRYQAGRQYSSMRSTTSASSLQLPSGESSEEFSSSSLPTKGRQRALQNKMLRPHDRSYGNLHGVSPHGRLRHPRPNSLAVAAISEDGDYVHGYVADDSSISGSEANDSVFACSSGTAPSPMTPDSDSVFHSNASTPVSSKHLVDNNLDGNSPADDSLQSIGHENRLTPTRMLQFTPNSVSHSNTSTPVSSRRIGNKELPKNSPADESIESNGNQDRLSTLTFPQQETPKSAVHSNTSTPDSSKHTFNNKLNENIRADNSMQNIGQVDRLSPPAFSPKPKHSSFSSHKSNSRSSSRSSRSSQKSQTFKNSPEVVQFKHSKSAGKADISKAEANTSHSSATLSQPKHAIYEKLQKPSSEPVLLTFKRLSTDLNHPQFRVDDKPKERCPKSHFVSDINTLNDNGDKDIVNSTKTKCSYSSSSPSYMKNVSMNGVTPEKVKLKSSSDYGAESQKTYNYPDDIYSNGACANEDPLNIISHGYESEDNVVIHASEHCSYVNGYGHGKRMVFQDPPSEEDYFSFDESLFDGDIVLHNDIAKHKDKFHGFFHSSSLIPPLEYINEETQDTVF